MNAHKPRRCGPPATCDLIHALKIGGTRRQIAAATRISERAVGEWIRQFRAERLVRVIDVLGNGLEIYKWIERGEPAEDCAKIWATPADRAAAWRKRRTRARVSTTPLQTGPDSHIFSPTQGVSS